MYYELPYSPYDIDHMILSISLNDTRGLKLSAKSLKESLLMCWHMHQIEVLVRFQLAKNQIVRKRTKTSNLMHMMTREKTLLQTFCTKSYPRVFGLEIDNFRRSNQARSNQVRI